MAHANDQERHQVGREMMLAFEYIQQVFRETAQLMTTLDGLVGAEWTPTYGNRITRGVTSHLGYPEDWLVRASFRIYDSQAEPGVRIGITVTYWGNGIEEPILVGGRMDYYAAEADSLSGSDHWDLWSAWFEEAPEDKRIDGSIYQVDPEASPLNDHIQEARVFAIPLVSIQSEEDIRTKVYDKLMKIAREAVNDQSDPCSPSEDACR